MNYFAFMVVLSTCRVNGYIDSNSNIPVTKPGGSQFTPRSYNFQKPNAALVRYTAFPETFPSHQIGLGLQNRLPYEMKPTNPKPGMIQANVPNSFRPVVLGPEQAMDHHFLTRPQSIISTPMGLQYMPHLINHQPYPAVANHQMEGTSYAHNPTSGLPRSGVTIIAKNIFIHNENQQKYPYASKPYEWIHYGEHLGQYLRPPAGIFRPEFLDKKQLLLGLLKSSDKPEEMVLENKIEVTDFAELKRPLIVSPARSGIIPVYSRPLGMTETLIRPLPFNKTPSQRPATAMVKPSSPIYSRLYTAPSKDVHIETPPSAQKEGPEIREYHPLLEPLEETIEENKTSMGNTEDTTMITVTGLENKSIETMRPQ